METTMKTAEKTKKTKKTYHKRILRPEFPEYVDQLTRFYSIKNSSEANTVKKTPKQLSAAGFFYDKDSSRFTCFSCGFAVEPAKWYRNFKPWKLHAYMCGRICDYMTMVKGSNYILDVYHLETTKFYRREDVRKYREYDRANKNKRAKQDEQKNDKIDTH